MVGKYSIHDPEIRLKAYQYLIKPFGQLIKKIPIKSKRFLRLVDVINRFYPDRDVNMGEGIMTTGGLGPESIPGDVEKVKKI